MAKKKQLESRPVEERKIVRIDKSATDAKAEKNLLLLERWTLVSDESGHRYVIPIARKIEFDAWSQMDTESEDFNCDLFNEFRIDGGLLTFADPRVN